jgi:hypothetical protein
LPPPCCDVAGNAAAVKVAIGPTLPPPCCDISREIFLSPQVRARHHYSFARRQVDPRAS